MMITQEIVDALAPKHCRTSCDDAELNNSDGGWSGRYDEKTGKKVIYYPRCHRCYLMDNIGKDFKDLEFEVKVVLEFREASVNRTTP